MKSLRTKLSVTQVTAPATSPPGLNKKGRKRPLYLMVALASCLVMALYNYFENRAVFLDELGTADVLHREKEILVNLRLAQLLGRQHGFDELKDRLEQARLNHDIDLFHRALQRRASFLGHGRWKIRISDFKLQTWCRLYQ